MNSGPPNSSQTAKKNVPHRPVPHRTCLGGDVFVTVDEGKPDQIQVDTGFAVEGWKYRPPRVPNRPAFPGTAVLFQERWYEIVALKRLGSRYVYELAPWEPSQTVRAPTELNAQTAQAATEAFRNKVRTEKAGTVATLLIPLVGLLPAEEQNRLESSLGIQPSIGTAISAGVMVIWSISSLLLAFAFSQGMDMGALKDYAEFCLEMIPLWIYLFPESLARLATGIRGEPLGSFLVAGPYSLIQTLIGRRPAAALGSERALPPAHRTPSGSYQLWLQATDVVKPLPADEHGQARIEILSRLPKQHWSANVHGIHWQGQTYVLDQREEVKPAPGRLEKYRFVLVQAHEEALFQNMHAYHPAEVREVYKAKRRLSVGTTLKTLGLLWGYTRPQFQETLAEIYGYDAWRNTKASIIFQILSGVFFFYTAVSRMSEGQAIAGDFFIFLFSIFLTWEGVLRFSRLNAGELNGSALGRGLEILARPALRWRAAPHWQYPDA